MTEPTQCELFPQAGGFTIVPLAEGFTLIDGDTFNNWASVSRLIFDTVANATDYAWRCFDFKRGGRSQVGDETGLVRHLDEPAAR